MVDWVSQPGLYLAGSLVKLQDSVATGNEHANAYRRIQAVVQASGKLRAVDLTRIDDRQAVLGASSVKILFESLLSWRPRKSPNFGFGGDCCQR